MARVEIENITKRYGHLEVVHGVSACIEDGEFVILVGPSGCGKSTLLRMIAGLEHISDGTISIDGEVVNDVAPKDRNIAMVFQNYALYPHMTVAQNMAFSLKLSGLGKDETRDKVGNAARILGLEKLLDRYPGQLSGGQRQRVAMGRAIVRDPEVFLFDEPLSNLDAKLRVQMRAEIKSLHQRLKTTTIYVTHDQVEAMTMADRIVVMRDGLIEQVGSPLDLYDEPANLFVAGFIGSPTMNFIEGAMEADIFRGTGGIECHSNLPAAFHGALVAGIRPDKIKLGKSGGPFEVLVVEPTGAETQVVVQSGDLQLVALVQGRVTYRPGESVGVTLDETAVHFFDARTEQRIEHLDRNLGSVSRQ
ncbi:ABC transporter ATP-binding protein [Sinorhizobium medicae]|uniref:ABC transporter ATP-binding protein n=1 Tax=Sinorhizobium medicae TaxID=110321 RepID=UPI000FD9E9C1|nr:sn-glycerol-3-phosphate ABC transporter ATP-binding protein UgpC [Sinorhizobium medicae]MQU78980.1 sn-glycerol-3-phosphate ABC transporter ATP-binding protein UgpC [Sinorhizobium medicae]RVJ36933.1 sn-glycerol-3-phosphate ABC transporter ATP-binding protein UgpC [Sinorhizobium medicae]TWA39569.1 carbohydrate ABC transporter ATP-binding protein (CUT1 family) [Sinorhizobium medicae]